MQFMFFFFPQIVPYLNLNVFQRTMKKKEELNQMKTNTLIFR